MEKLSISSSKKARRNNFQREITSTNLEQSNAWNVTRRLSPKAPPVPKLDSARASGVLKVLIKVEYIGQLL
ncbi:unnamed protein product [Thelazia callipaeda]|uniref:Uncharacterized protein n=1 Tax=Thelazia callipaeda TaxID=103827 RepID=A0A0N5CX50_THECL|nr:unnamed protein product [Thelazia callipaeda]